MESRFHDRDAELTALRRAWSEPGAKLALVWGRRRTGKTRLLGEFVRGLPSIFHAATEQSAAAELAEFSRITRTSLPPTTGDLLAHADFPDWSTALTYLAGRARRHRLVVVFDEFPYLVSSDPSLPSVIQRFWDHEARRSRLFVVLCGSAQSVMADLQATRAPLFGRVDLRLKLEPFGHREAALFHSRLSPTERVIAYGVLGGMPVYLERWSVTQGHRANIRHLFGDPTSPLLHEGEFVLTGELPEAAGYFRILRAIAAGHRTYNRMRAFADIDIARQLDRLMEIGLVERVVPAGEDPARTKRAMYMIGDNFLAFWFRFVYRHRADIARGLGAEVVDRMILPGLGDHMGEAWEQVWRSELRRRAAMGLLGLRVSSIGAWWNRDHSVQIDAVGLDGKKAVFAASVKWSGRAGPGELNALRSATEALPNRADRLQLAIVARDEVRSVATGEALTYTARDLYDTPD